MPECVTPVLLLPVFGGEDMAAPGYALLRLDSACAHKLLVRMDLVGQMAGQDDALEEMHFRDYSARFMDAGGTENDALTEAEEQVMEEGAPIELDDALIGEAGEHAQGLRYQSAVVTRSGVYWQARAKHGTGVYESEVVGRRELVRALYLGLEDRELDAVVRRYAADVPWETLALIEGQLQIDGRPDWQRPAPELGNEALSALLQHANSDIRARAFRALGKTEQRGQTQR